MLVGIAWRNIWRNKKRSLIILTAIVLGLCGGVFATGLMIGMAESMVSTAIDRYLGHIEIHTPTFRVNPLVNDFLPSGDSLVAALRSTPNVSGVSGRTLVEGMASSPASSSGVQIVGVVPADESAVSTLARRMVAGTYLSEDGRLPVLIGKKLAGKLEVRLHSKIVLSFAGRDGSIIYGSFRVVGIFETESTVFDNATLFVRTQDFAALLGGPTLIHEIAVRLTRADMVPQVLQALRVEYPALKIDSWQDLAPELKLTYEMTDIGMLFFLGIILIGLLFGITNTMLMSVLDRVREFGVLMAIGMKRKRVFWLVMLETIFLSLTGGVIGVLLGVVIIEITSHTGINLAVVAEGLSSYGISSVLYPFMPVLMYLELGILIVLTAIGAAIYPGLKATKLNPATSIGTYG